MTQKRSARMRSDSVKNMSAYADQNHAPSLTDVRLEYGRVYGKIMIQGFTASGFYVDSENLTDREVAEEI